MAVFLCGAKRTPIASFLGQFATLSAPDLGASAIQGALAQSGLAPESIQEVYLGNVLTAGVGQAPARQALIKAGLPTSTGATTVGKVCGSGMKAIMLGRLELLSGEADLVIAGGMESMSQAPHLLKKGRTGTKMGHQQLLDSMILDGLWDPYGDVHMGNCAERCAEKYSFSREAQDAYATQSYQRAINASNQGDFEAEIVPVSVPQLKGDPLMVSTDEEPTSVDYTKMGGLRPAFEKTGTITAGNASTLNDGAAAVVLASEKAVQANGLKPLAKIISVATHSQDPTWFTTAPVGAIQKALQKAGLSVADIDLFEINEAFAVVAMAAIEDLKLDPEKVNIKGGAIALGHPIGASGARIVVTLAHALRQNNKRYGVASLCIGGGEATAIVIENVS